MKKPHFFFAFLALAAHLVSFGQPGTLDLTFNPGTGIDDYPNACVVQSDGKIIFGGGFTTYNGTTVNGIVRTNADGTIDPLFNTGTGFGGTPYCIAIQSDGKIVVSGAFFSYNGTAWKNVARLSTDGTLDTSLDPGTGTAGIIQAMAMQTDGKFIIGGTFTSYNGTARKNIARINADGSLDTSFDPGTGADDAVRTISIQDDGKIIVGGEFTTYNGTSANYIMRLNADGTLDPAFDTGTGANSNVLASAIQPDGQILIGGSFYIINGTSITRIARLNTDGSLDSSFDPGAGPSLQVGVLTLQTNGKILIGGSFSMYDGISSPNLALINSDGSLNTAFETGTGPNGTIEAITVQNDGRIIIGGYFQNYNGTPIIRVARINHSAVGLNETALTNKFEVYPNPFTGQATIRIAMPVSDATLTVYNTFGQVVKQIDGISSQTILLAGDGLPAGVYFVRIEENGNAIATGAVIVEE